MTITIDDKLAASIETIAARRGMTVDAVVAESLRAWLKGAELADKIVAIARGLGAADTVPQLAPFSENVIPIRRE